MNSRYEDVTDGVVDWVEGIPKVPGEEIMSRALDLPDMIAMVAAYQDVYKLSHFKAVRQVVWDVEDQLEEHEDFYELCELYDTYYP